MTSSIITQPAVQLGHEIDRILANEQSFSRIVLVSAFVAIRTILRLRDRLLAQARNGCVLRLNIGIDLGGTSREVLEELLCWECEVFVFHNPLLRATFHPKVYLFESNESAVLIIGSNNLTEGGFFTNYEAATRHDFDFPGDTEEYRRIIAPLWGFLAPAGRTAQALTANLIDLLVVRGELPTESQVRGDRRGLNEWPRDKREGTFENPFAIEAMPMPPLLPQQLRRERSPARLIEPLTEPRQDLHSERPTGLLVWKKRLSQSDALQVRPGTHHVGGVRLTQAGFENPAGWRIDQTTYFRNLFGNFQWEQEGRHVNQEHTFVSMRVFVRGHDYGVRKFEISHKPSGEAGQHNYTTILRWGNFRSTVQKQNLTGVMLSLYETPQAEAPFLLDLG